jgi:glucokinase
VLDAFVEAFGAEAGNLALRPSPRGGVFGGGLRRRFFPRSRGRFMNAFREAPFEKMLEAMPVKVILT